MSDRRVNSGHLRNNVQCLVSARIAAIVQLSLLNGPAYYDEDM